MPSVGAVRQVALSAGRNLDATLAFWHDVLGLPLHSRFDPPGMAFIMAGEVRLDITDIDTFHAEAKAAGVPFTAAPAMVHHDVNGLFGPAGQSEWMAFLKDPAGNTIGLVERKVS